MEDIMQVCSLFGFQNESSSKQFYSIDITTSVLNGCFLLVAVTLNSAVIYAVWQTSTLRSSFYVAIASLSSTNCAIALLAQPSFIAVQMQELLGNVDRYCIAQIINISISMVCFDLSFMFLFGMMLGQYLSLRRSPGNPVTMTMTIKTLLKMVIFLWISVSSIAALCAYVKVIDDFLFFSAIASLVWILLLFSLNLKICLVIRRYLKQVQHQLEVPSVVVESTTPHISHHKRIATAVFYIFITSFMTQVPLICTVIISQLLGWSPSKKAAFLVSMTFAYFGSSIHPFIYVWRLKEIRQTVFSIIPSVPNILHF